MLNGIFGEKIIFHMPILLTTWLPLCMYIMYAIPTTPFRDERLQLFLKSVKVNAILHRSYIPPLEWTFYVKFYRSVLHSQVQIFYYIIFVRFLLCVKTIEYLVSFNKIVQRFFFQ